jgi:hypothetical protein
MKTFLAIDENDKKICDSISLFLKSYVIKGAAIVESWDDVVGAIKMEPIVIPAIGIYSESDLKKTITASLNDGGFGSKNIKGAYIEIFARYYEDVEYDNGCYFEKIVRSEFISVNDEELDENEKDLAFEIFLYSN